MPVAAATCTGGWCSALRLWLSYEIPRHAGDSEGVSNADRVLTGAIHPFRVGSRVGVWRAGTVVVPRHLSSRAGTTVELCCDAEVWCRGRLPGVPLSPAARQRPARVGVRALASPVSAFSRHLIAKARSRLWKTLGALGHEHEGVAGTRFAVWAPNARRVSVVGGFNMWDGRRHLMAAARRHRGVGRFLHPRIGEGEGAYKYEIRDGGRASWPAQGRPAGFRLAASAAECLGRARHHRLRLARSGLDGNARGAQRAHRADLDLRGAGLPLWRRKGDRADLLQEAAGACGLCRRHGPPISKLMPISEYPFDGLVGAISPWAFSPPTVRHGPPHEFRDLVGRGPRQGPWRHPSTGARGIFRANPHGLGQFDAPRSTNMPIRARGSTRTGTR